MAMAALGPAFADQEKFEVDLRPGENEVLVEIGQSGGNWGMYFRLADPDGRLLALDDEGNLERLDESAE